MMNKLQNNIVYFWKFYVVKSIPEILPLIYGIMVNKNWLNGGSGSEYWMANAILNHYLLPTSCKSFHQHRSRFSLCQFSFSLFFLCMTTWILFYSVKYWRLVLLWSLCTDNVPIIRWHVYICWYNQFGGRNDELDR